MIPIRTQLYTRYGIFRITMATGVSSSLRRQISKLIFLSIVHSFDQVSWLLNLTFRETNELQVWSISSSWGWIPRIVSQRTIRKLVLITSKDLQVEILRSNWQPTGPKLPYPIMGHTHLNGPMVVTTLLTMFVIFPNRSNAFQLFSYDRTFRPVSLHPTVGLESRFQVGTVS